MKLPHRTPKTKSASVKNDAVLEEPFAKFLVFKNVKFVRQYKPIPTRLYKSDFYLPDFNLIIEIEGGQWVNGRHQRGYGFKQDIEKYNALTLAGYKILRLTTDHFLRIGQKDYMVSGYSASLLDKIFESWGERVERDNGDME